MSFGLGRYSPDEFKEKREDLGGYARQATLDTGFQEAARTKEQVSVSAIDNTVSISNFDRETLGQHSRVMQQRKSEHTWLLSEVAY